MKSNLTHPLQKEDNEDRNLLNLFREEHVGQFCMTDHGVGTCKSVNFDGWCMVEVAGLGSCQVKINEIVW